MTPVTIYVGMALTDAPESFRTDFQRDLKRKLTEVAGVHILDFVGLEKGTAEDVYYHDRDCTESAELCVFICDHPSIGLGMEIAFRIVTGKPMLCFAAAGKKVTRMVTGACEAQSVEFHRYDNVLNIIFAVEEMLIRMQQKAA
ncbi:MAG: hypothetical protein R3B69_03070 [Candidatus Paceibacterota bacterium]